MGTRSVITALRVLEAVAELQPVGLSELSRVVEVPKATVQRMLMSLEELQWIEKSSTVDTRWSISIHAYAVTSRGSSGSRIRDVSMGPLNSLQLDTAETVHLAVPDGMQMVVIERLDTPHVLRAFLPLGSRLAMHASATGLAFLSSSADSFLDEYLRQPLEALTSNTMGDESEIRREVEAIRRRKYSINPGGLSQGITSLGATIVSRELNPVGSISISGPSSRITSDLFAQYGEAVSEAAHRISLAMPY